MVLLVRIQYLTSRISPHSPDYAVSSIWKGMEGLVQTATPNLSQDGVCRTHTTPPDCLVTSNTNNLAVFTDQPK